MFYANLNINVQFACIDYKRVSVGQCLKKVIWLKKNQNMRRKNATKPKTLKKFWYGLTKRPIKIYCRFSMKVNRYRHSSNSLYAKGLKTNKKRVGSQHYKHRTDPKIHSKSLYNNDKCIKNNRGNLKTLYHTVPKFSRLFHTKKKGIYKNDKCIKNNRKNKGQNQPPITRLKRIALPPPLMILTQSTSKHLIANLRIWTICKAILATLDF